MTTTTQIHATIAPDWADADRLRPIEELIYATSTKAVFDYVLKAVGSVDPAEFSSVKVLIEALEAVEIDDHSLHLRSSINAILLDEELRATVWIGLAIKGIPGAAAEAAQGYAKLAHQLAYYVWSHEGKNPEQRRILRRLVDRIAHAEITAVGLCLVAAGVEDPSPRIGGIALTDARDLASRIITAPRAIKRRAL
ncbi:MAG TPA: hypothetical protein VGO06_15990 [Bosea sp. (in: a-proteobacteria)]|jgi:hypothetical protein|uniref:hypothetical protein n=1 Tax=Bosea sp. (in: a-proteobacteria) TaxID=1871050 RepID=UPI002E112766|nr:hypothetical protein [Bosea sp. (in: a-proteobacteria)]